MGFKPIVAQPIFYSIYLFSNYETTSSYKNQIRRLRSSGRRKDVVYIIVHSTFLITKIYRQPSVRLDVTVRMPAAEHIDILVSLTGRRLPASEN